MARPRIFVSSTYFDLRVLRADLERFIREMGYEAVMFERGHIPYGSEQALEEYCYREIASCDILISIIGGKFGSQSKDQKSSISQREMKAAIDLGKTIYIFVEKSVLITPEMTANQATELYAESLQRAAMIAYGLYTSRN